MISRNTDKQAIVCYLSFDFWMSLLAFHVMNWKMIVSIAVYNQEELQNTDLCTLFF